MRYTIISSRTGVVLFQTDNEDEANVEFDELIHLEGIPVEFL